MPIGDVNSTERGSGARYNDNKPDMSLIPLRLVAQSLRMLVGDDSELALVYALTDLGRFQETGNLEHLDSAMEWMHDRWPDCAHVFSYGRKKYASWNWAKGMDWSIPLACAARHVIAHFEDGPLDAESGHTHFGHFLCNVVMLRTFVETYPEGNDLPDPALFTADAPDAPTQLRCF